MRCSRPTSGSPERGPDRGGVLTARLSGPGLEWGGKEGPSRAGWLAVGVRSGPSGPGCGVGEKGGRLGSAASARSGAGTWGHRGDVGGPSAHASVLALPLAVVCFAILLSAISPHCRVSSLRTETWPSPSTCPLRGLHRWGLNVCCINERREESRAARGLRLLHLGELVGWGLVVE